MVNEDINVMVMKIENDLARCRKALRNLRQLRDETNERIEYVIGKIARSEAQLAAVRNGQVKECETFEVS